MENNENQEKVAYSYRDYKQDMKDIKSLGKLNKKAIDSHTKLDLVCLDRDNKRYALRHIGHTTCKWLALGLCVIMGFSACSKMVKESNVEPTVEIIEDRKGAISYPSTFVGSDPSRTDYLPFYNYSDKVINLEYQDNDDFVIYSADISPNSCVNISYNAGQSHWFYINSVDHSSMLYNCNNSNYAATTTQYYKSVSLLNGNEILEVYSPRQSSYYLDLNKDLTPNQLEYSMVFSTNSTSVAFTREITCECNNFSLNLSQGYENLYNVFNRLNVKYYCEPYEYGYRWACDLFAKNSNNSKSMLIGTTREFTSPVLDTSNANAISIVNSGGVGCFGSVFKLAPYLQDAKINSASDYLFSVLNSSNTRSFASFVRSYGTHVSKIILSDNIDSDNLWASFGDLIKITFLSILPFMSLQILPMVTIGALVFAPFFLLFVIWILKLVRKQKNV